ncbi:MAG: polyprenyl synthetase family protein [Candidatus Desulfofervidaceae bacterium]|nr:polyprenyl synthetase family protein [Candidatus Desulfofervidaceae bacterium]
MSSNRTFNLKSYLQERKMLVEEALEHYLSQQEGIYSSILEAMRYSLFAGGKRLRPILCLAATEAVGGKKETALPVGCALEMIHTYSLIHDDLPAMDNDDLRRGKPTNHKVFGTAMAILAGDGLLTEAFSLLTHPDLTQQVPAERLMRVIHLIAEAAGYKGMVGGQVMDLKFTGQEIDLEALETMHRHKTGALIVASVKSGAIIGEGNETEIEALGEYATQIGLAFQIVDDILDIEGTSEEMGKNPGSDKAQQKATYPALLGVKRAKEIAEKCIEKAIEALKPFEEEAEPLRALAQYIRKRRK